MLLFEDFVVEDNKLIIPGENANGIFQIDIESWKSHFLYGFRRSLYGKREYGRCVKYKNKVFLLPMSAEKITVFNIEKSLVEEIEIPQIDCKIPQHLKGEKFFAYSVWKNMLYLYAWRYPAIIRVDMDTYNARAVLGWKELFDKYVTDTQLVYFRKDVLTDGKYAYLITWNYPVIFQLDMETMEFTVIEIQHCQKGFSTICLADSKVVLSDREGDIYITDRNFTEINQIEFGDKDKKYVFKESFYLDGKVWFVSSLIKLLVCLDCTTWQFDYVSMNRAQEDVQRILCAKPISSHEILIESTIGETVVYDIRKKELIQINIDMSDSKREYCKSVDLNIPDIVLYENPMYLLEDFVSGLTLKQQGVLDRTQEDNFGSVIMSTMAGKLK